MEQVQAKKMSLMQLTVIVSVNMMGSGIIMLPTNMAQVGAISLLSWIVTALGSMAIAYGFAQAGVLNQRSGGMSAYAEEAYGKSGFFIVFYLYFLSLAIGNVAIAISAVGYLASFMPWLASTPLATCIGVIALIWLTTVANFGGPKVTGRIGAVTVWGVIIPVAGLSIIGWFWFSKATFAAAWNPHGLSLLEGMGSSIALTLWAFLGMESAAQNSAAVENPKRNVPLACLLGTLGAAVIYVLSTTVIQGIVPNAELANSTGPFGLAYAKMFNPTIGSIIMALAIMACLGSLLGWQFTISQTGKSAAEDRMFPAFFAKVSENGAPIAGMIVMAIVQSADGALDDLADAQRAVQRAREPGRGHQRDPLHHRALGADRDDAEGRRGGVDLSAERRGGGGRDALQHLCDLRVGPVRGARRHGGDGAGLRDLWLPRAPLRARQDDGRPPRRGASRVTAVQERPWPKERKQHAARTITDPALA